MPTFPFLKTTFEEFTEVEISMLGAEMRLKIITFASPHLGWRLARIRFCREARNFGFQEVQVFTPRKLKRLWPDFYNQHKRLLRTEPKGAGLWIWKPHIVQKVLENSAGQNCCVIYVDIGASINSTLESRLRFLSYVEAARGSGGFCFELESQPTAAWISETARSALHLSEEELWKNQICATVFGFAPTKEALALVSEWAHLCEKSDYENLRDPEAASTDPRFKAHRHDQAIFSVLARRSSITVFQDETYFYPDWHELGGGYPFWASRRQSILSLVEAKSEGVWRRSYSLFEARVVRFDKILRTLRLKLARFFLEST